MSDHFRYNKSPRILAQILNANPDFELDEQGVRKDTPKKAATPTATQKSVTRTQTPKKPEKKIAKVPTTTPKRPLKPANSTTESKKQKQMEVMLASKTPMKAIMSAPKATATAPRKPKSPTITGTPARPYEIKKNAAPKAVATKKKGEELQLVLVKTPEKTPPRALSTMALAIVSASDKVKSSPRKSIIKTPAKEQQKKTPRKSNVTKKEKSKPSLWKYADVRRMEVTADGGVDVTVYNAKGEEWTEPIQSFSQIVMDNHFYTRLWHDPNYPISAELNEAVFRAKNFYPEKHRDVRAREAEKDRRAEERLKKKKEKEAEKKKGKLSIGTGRRSRVKKEQLMIEDKKDVEMKGEDKTEESKDEMKREEKEEEAITEDKKDEVKTDENKDDEVYKRQEEREDSVDDVRDYISEDNNHEVEEMQGPLPTERLDVKEEEGMNEESPLLQPVAAEEERMASPASDPHLTAMGEEEDMDEDEATSPAALESPNRTDVKEEEEMVEDEKAEEILAKDSNEEANETVATIDPLEAARRSAIPSQLDGNLDASYDEQIVTGKSEESEQDNTNEDILGKLPLATGTTKNKKSVVWWKGGKVVSSKGKLAESKNQEALETAEKIEAATPAVLGLSSIEPADEIAEEVYEEMDEEDAEEMPVLAEISARDEEEVMDDNVIRRAIGAAIDPFHSMDEMLADDVIVPTADLSLVFEPPNDEELGILPAPAAQGPQFALYDDMPFNSSYFENTPPMEIDPNFADLLDTSEFNRSGGSQPAPAVANQPALVDNYVDLSDGEDEVVYLSSLPPPSATSKIILAIDQGFRKIVADTHTVEGFNVFCLSGQRLYPYLSIDCKAVVEAAWSCRRRNVKIRRGLDISVESLQTLRPNHMISGQIIEYFLTLVCRSTVGEMKPPRESMALETSFFTHLTEGRSMARYTRELHKRKNDFKTHLDRIFIPIHLPLDKHWCLVVVDTSCFQMNFLDSLDRCTLAQQPAIMERLRVYFESLFPSTAGRWQYIRRPSTQQADNTLDCGAHVMLNAMCIAKGREPLYPAEAVNYIRHRAVVQLAENRFHVQ